ncbi:MAG: glycosyl transferase [Candidatus Binatia bacterium]|nr:glycosyl transferase [Candidatus Binatia bacterium]
MSDFHQDGPVTTLHDLGDADRDRLEDLLSRVTPEYPIGLVLPVTAADLRAAPFARIVEELRAIDYIDQICVVLGDAPATQDARDARELVGPLGAKAEVLWTDGPAMQLLYRELTESGFPLGVPGKGRSVWTAFGYLLADPRLKAFALHDCDIVDYDRILLARLCLPMAHPSLDFEFAKAFYHRSTDRMHGRVTRLLVSPLLQSLIALLGRDPFLLFLSSFRYPLSGEFAITSALARSNRVPSDWGLEIGALAEVYRNTSAKRVCQVDLCVRYEHKHQDLSLDDPDRGLMKMATEILSTLFRTLATRGTVIDAGHVSTLRAAYLRVAQDIVRQYHADALVNGLAYDRQYEERAVEGFARQIQTAGDAFQEDPSGGAAIPNWTRVLTAFPDLPSRLREAARQIA